MKRYQRTVASQYLVIALSIGAIVGVGALGFLAMNRLAFADHFAIPWAAGRIWLLEGESPYSNSAFNTASAAINESTFLAELPDTQFFTPPILTLIFYLPFSLIPYTISRIIWVTVLCISFGFIGILSLNFSKWNLPFSGRFIVVLFLVFWLPSSFAIVNGFLAPIIISLLLLSFYLIQMNQDTTAGFLLSLTFSSFPTSGLILILLLFWSISHRRWSIITGFFAGVGFLFVISFLILPSWFRDWVSVLLNQSISWDWVQTPLMDLAALLPGVVQPLTIFLHIVFGIYALILIISLMGQSGHVFTYRIFTLMILAYLLHVQGSIVYLPLIIPPIFLVFRFWAERWGVFGHLLSWLVLVIIGAGSWLLVTSEVDFTASMAPPLLTIAFPLFVFLGMIWIRWWALRIPKLPYGEGKIQKY